MPISSDLCPRSQACVPGPLSYRSVPVSPQPKPWAGLSGDTDHNLRHQFTEHCSHGAPATTCSLKQSSETRQWGADVKPRIPKTCQEGAWLQVGVAVEEAGCD